MTVFLLVIIPTEFRLVHNPKENCLYGHISYNLKGNGALVACNRLGFVSLPVRETRASRHNGGTTEGLL